MKDQPKFQTYMCKVLDFPEQVYVAVSAGKAKAECFRDLRDSWPDIPYTKIRVRCTGGLRTDAQFKLMAESRDIQFARIGMRVIVTRLGEGTIVGHNSSANLNVIFDDRPNLTLNCHPHCEIAYLDESGNVIRNYRKPLVVADEMKAVAV